MDFYSFDADPSSGNPSCFDTFNGIGLPASLWPLRVSREASYFGSLEVSLASPWGVQLHLAQTKIAFPDRSPND